MKVMTCGLRQSEMTYVMCASGLPFLLTSRHIRNRQGSQPDGGRDAGPIIAETEADAPPNYRQMSGSGVAPTC